MCVVLPHGSDQRADGTGGHSALSEAVMVCEGHEGIAATLRDGRLARVGSQCSDGGEAGGGGGGAGDAQGGPQWCHSPL